MFGRHAVEDWETWRKVYEEFNAGRWAA